MYQLGWFSTGRDEAARDLLTAANNGINSVGWTDPAVLLQNSYVGCGSTSTANVGGVGSSADSLLDRMAKGLGLK